MIDFGFYNVDCMTALKDIPDKYIDLAIVDPPYGGGSDDHDATRKRYGGKFDKYFMPDVAAERDGGQWAKKYGRNINHWDVAPPQEYFEELFRVSKNQIIWGGELLFITPDALLYRLAKVNHFGKLFNGDGRVRMDEL